MTTLEQKIYAVSLVRDQGLSLREAEKISGVSHETIRRWRSRLEGSVSGLYSFDVQRKCNERSIVDIDINELPDDPEELKKIIFDMQFEMDLKEAIVDILKKDPGVDPKMLPNQEKAILVDALRKKKTYSTGWILSYIKLAPATFYYHRKALGIDKEKDLREKIRMISAEHPEFGYRRTKNELEKDSDFAHTSEKRIISIMRDENLQPPRRRKNSRYNSYDSRKDKGCPLPNAPLQEDGKHDFKSPCPNRLWVSDVTEFHLPNDDRVYLSPVLDCFDSSLMSWVVSTSEKAEDLTNPSLQKAAENLNEDDNCTAHTDRGGQYFSAGWIKICEQYGITRSMSRKGHSPDNARIEGFFGRLKMEFFDTRDWRGVSTEKFTAELDKWLVYYNEKRAKQSLNWLSPMQYRKRYYEAA